MKKTILTCDCCNVDIEINNPCGYFTVQLIDLFKWPELHFCKIFCLAKHFNEYLEKNKLSDNENNNKDENNEKVFNENSDNTMFHNDFNVV